MIKVNKLWYFLKGIENRFAVFLLSYISTESERVWENSKKLWKHWPVRSCSHSISYLPNFQLCFYNLRERWYMFSISLIRNHYHITLYLFTISLLTISLRKLHFRFPKSYNPTPPSIKVHRMLAGGRE